MTALLQCDGCGNVVGERADDYDSTRTWWCLSPAPTIGGGLLPMIDLTMDGLDHDEPEEPEVLGLVDPPRHFCSEDCGEAWFRRRREDREATP